MRVILGIAISLPIVVFFCVAYLTALAIEAWRDKTRIRRERWRDSQPGDAWTSLVRIEA